MVIARALIIRGWWSNDDFVVHPSNSEVPNIRKLYILSSLFVYGIILVRQISLPPPPHGSHNWPFLGTYILSSIINLSLLTLSFSTPPPPSNIYDYIHIIITAVRTLLFLSLAVVSEILRIRPISFPDYEADAPFLKANGSTSHYGTFDAGPTHPHSGRGGFGSNPPPSGGWITYVKSFKVTSLEISNVDVFRCSFHICGLVQIDIYRVL